MAQVQRHGGYIWFACTHEPDAHEIIDELQSLFPWKVDARKWDNWEGHQTTWVISKCQDRHDYAIWWMLRQLGERGWEPFAAFAMVEGSSSSTGSNPTYVFRKKIEQ